MCATTLKKSLITLSFYAIHAANFKKYLLALATALAIKNIPSAETKIYLDFRALQSSKIPSLNSPPNRMSALFWQLHFLTGR